MLWVEGMSVLQQPNGETAIRLQMDQTALQGSSIVSVSWVWIDLRQCFVDKDKPDQKGKM
jgi:hypothetical protein